MSNGRRDDLESRVARLEQVLERVLEVIQELKADRTGPPGPFEEVAEELRGQVAGKVGARSAEEAATAPAEKVEAGSAGEARAGSVSEAAARERAAYESRDVYAEGPGLLEKLGIYPLRGVFLSRLGIVLLLLSIGYFFKYSIDQGWLVPAVRLAIGLITGVALVALGFKGASRGEPLGTALAGGGIATFFITGYTGHQWYSLVSYPVAFGFLFLASVLGIFLSLRSGLQALAVVGLVGALATPLLLAAETAEVAGLALYVSLIVASVAVIYLIRAWRALFLLSVLTALPVLAIAVGEAGGTSGISVWVVQGGIGFSVLVFWLAPLLRAGLRAKDPGQWLRPESAYPAEVASEPSGGAPLREGRGWGELGRRSAAGGPYVPWSAHLDALSLLMPLVGILLSTWLWDLSRIQLGWVFLGVALLAQGVGWRISRHPDPEDSASTQSFVAILLSTVGLGLVLTGDILYLAFIAEAAALMVVGSRKGSLVVTGLGGGVELIVLGLFLTRLVSGGTLLEGDLSSLFDLAAVGGAALIGTRLRSQDARRAFFVISYLGLLAFTARELSDHTTFLYLAFLIEGVATHLLAARNEIRLLEGLGFLALTLVGAFFLFGFQSGRTLEGGDLALLVDIAALLGTTYVATLVSKHDVRQGLFLAVYLGFLALMGRELQDHLSLLYLMFVLTAVVTQFLASRREVHLFSALGHVPAFLALSFFATGMGTDNTLFAGDLTSFIDLAAIGGAAYLGTLLDRRQGRSLYFFAAYAGLLAWTGRELYPFEQGQALMSFAFGLEGTAVLVAGFLRNRPVLQKVGMATLLLVVAKVMLVDLAAVEPIWRVLLLFVFGGLFLLLSRLVQGRKEGRADDERATPDSTTS